MEFTIEVLTQAKKLNLTTQFKELTNKQILQKAQQCNQIMKEFPINSLLISTTMPEFKESLVALWKHMNKLQSILDSYGKNRAVQLAEALSRELCNSLIKYLKGVNIVFIKYSDFQINIIGL